MTDSDKTEELRDLFTSVTGVEEVTEEQEEGVHRATGEEEEERKGLPTTEEKCPECENDTAFWYLQQTRAADESETRFYICTECENKWRDYD